MGSELHYLKKTMEFIDIITMHLVIYNNSKSTENNINNFDNLHHVGIFARPKRFDTVSLYDHIGPALGIKPLAEGL